MRSGSCPCRASSKTRRDERSPPRLWRRGRRRPAGLTRAPGAGGSRRAARPQLEAPRPPRSPASMRPRVGRAGPARAMHEAAGERSHGKASGEAADAAQLSGQASSAAWVSARSTTCPPRGGRTAASPRWASAREPRAGRLLGDPVSRREPRHLLLGAAVHDHEPVEAKVRPASTRSAASVTRTAAPSREGARPRASSSRTRGCTIAFRRPPGRAGRRKRRLPGAHGRWLRRTPGCRAEADTRRRRPGRPEPSARGPGGRGRACGGPAARRRRTSDFPQAMPPVSPTRSTGRLSRSARPDGVLHEHRDRQRAHAARHGSEGRRHLAHHGVMHVSHERVTFRLEPMSRSGSSSTRGPPSSMRFMPTSTTTAPGFTCSARMSPAGRSPPPGCRLRA